MSKRSISAMALIVALETLGCSDSVAPPKAATIEVNSFANLVAFAGSSVGDNPEVLVRDGNGQPISGIQVKFMVTAGGGSITNATTVSGPQGRATAGAWILGPAAGLNTLVGSVDGVGSVQFSAQAVPFPTGTFQLATIDGASLPFTDIWSSNRVVVGGTFTLASDRTYSYVLRVRRPDGAVVDEDRLSGSFGPKGQTALSFFVDDWPWVDGSVQGDTLVAYIWDFSDNLHPYVFVRESSS